MRLAFMGTPEFAVPSLRALASNHEIHLVVTQPDRPSGRGRALLPPPVKTEALKMGLRVVQPENANHPDVLAVIRETTPQVLVVVAYGCILKKPLLETPTIACVNLHASLLPRYRGVAPINWAIMNGERVTGVTTIRMDEGIDTGPILLQKRVEIKHKETAGELSERLAQAGAELLLKTVERLGAGTMVETAQDHSKATYARKLKKDDGLIQWDASAEDVVNHIRGMTPWPGATVRLEGVTIKLLEAAVVEAPVTASGQGSRGEPGTIAGLTSDGPLVATGRGLVILHRLCPEGKKPMTGAEWAKGQRGVVNRKLIGRPSGDANDGHEA